MSRLNIVWVEIPDFTELNLDELEQKVKQIERAIYA